MEWVLVIIYGITGWGPGGRESIPYPSEESCYKALNSMIISADTQQAGDDDEQVIAYCRPEGEQHG
jgi:hypothetical protein